MSMVVALSLAIAMFVSSECPQIVSIVRQGDIQGTFAGTQNRLIIQVRPMGDTGDVQITLFPI